MRLRALRRHWDRLAQQDPLWAVLTDPGKRDGGWDVDQFFRAGTEELSAVLQRAARLGIAVSRRRALDFGCGVGRVTQAMAGSFERCDGVDISASMLQLARRHNRDPARCSYHLNVADDLRLFPDAAFTFVFSTLVLQHIAPAYTSGYIKELLRVLAPGGLLVFQLPSHRTAQLSSDHTAGRTVAARLPVEACRARIAAERTELLLQAEQQADVKVTVENGVLTLQGERRQEKEEKGKRFHRVERSYGSFVRSFTLPESVDESSVKAEYKDGVLNLHLPKSEKVKPKAIDVKVA